jgi:hypothetical protein
VWSLVPLTQSLVQNVQLSDDVDTSNQGIRNND